MASKAAEGHIASKQDLRSSWEGRGTSGGGEELRSSLGEGGLRDSWKAFGALKVRREAPWVGGDRNGDGKK